MSLTRWVPFSVPSDVQSSEPCELSQFSKRNVRPTLAKLRQSHGAMSSVPAAVPSDRQSPQPWVGSEAVNRSLPSTFVKLNGVEPPCPGQMSLTILVPAAVPSDRQSS